MDLATEMTLVDLVVLGDSLVKKRRTTTRQLIVLAGLPEPVVNHIEYDGRQHAQDDRQWGRDLDRREELDADGWRLIVVRAKGIYTEPGRTLERIVDAMRSCGARGLPATLTREWERYFPGR